mgnify:CR=1 FL=1
MVYILAILVLIALTNFLGYTRDAELVAMQADVKVISNVALIYNIENGTQWSVSDTDAVIAEGEVVWLGTEKAGIKDKEGNVWFGITENLMEPVTP